MSHSPARTVCSAPPDLAAVSAALLAKYPEEDVFDGNVAAAHIAYACTDAAFIYPITPSTPMAEIYEQWSNAGRLNVLGQVPRVKQLQSEAGAAGAVHGSLSCGALTTTFTASQGLLLMIPPMYKIAGELQPCVFHVAARAIAGQALSIFGDHSDVMAVRQTGWALLSSATVQEAQDMAAVAHMATMEAKVPFVHFFDGFRTSHELQKIKVLDYMTLRNLLNYKAIENFRERSLNPTRPYTKGSAQGPEVYFQNVELANKYYNECSAHVIRAMEKYGKATGRYHTLFEYYGCPTATSVIVVMGSGYPVIKEAIDWMEAAGGRKELGVLCVKLFRPWSLEHFLAALPSTVTRVCVLDRVKEPGALGEPLFLDVAASLQSSKDRAAVKCVGGRYGLGSRDFTPAMVIAVFDNLLSFEPKHGFTVGIMDDLTHTSLDYVKYVSTDCVPVGTTQCMFWGMGSDGTVGANKNVIKILGMNTPLQVQGYFAYSAHKAGGLTVSHLRFGPKEITSSYLLQACDYIAVHRATYLSQYDTLAKIKRLGTVVLNTEWADADIDRELPGQVKQQIAKNKVKLYAIDANKVAAENGMGRRINNVLMTSFFKVSGVLPFEQAIGLFKTAIQKTYGKKGAHVVEANWKCVDAAVHATREVVYNEAEWVLAPHVEVSKGHAPTRKMAEPPAFVSNVMVALMSGEDLPTSAFAPFEGGIIPPGVTGYEKRAIALNVPIVDMDKCTQCNQCSFVCPHAAIRPFLLDDDEAEKAPEAFTMRKCKGPSTVAQYRFRIQVSPMDCTGCELCFIACPDDALTMVPYEQVQDKESQNWDFSQMITEKSEDVEPETRLTLKGSQFYTPMMEFSGACEGCGETPYVKLLTQLFGERLVIANATGCSSIWGASYPANAYTVNQKGYGPAWANSLFEDNAEYGFGMATATGERRQQLRDLVLRLLEDEHLACMLSEPLKGSLSRWLLSWTDATVCAQEFEILKELLPQEKEKHQLVMDIYNARDLFPRLSQWIVGGDGWAYDIGFGGLDHVVASGIDVNILVMDTEVYSNTGGQSSKATPLGAVHKFAAGGRLRNKKDLGAICMEYGDVYVASVASSANMTQTVRAFVEAESFPGTSIIMAYSPCIEHQYIKPFNLQIDHCKLAVNSGFWPLYRYDPRLMDENLPPFQLDSKKIKADIISMVRKENRFAILRRANPKLADDLEIRLKDWATKRFEGYVQRSLGPKGVAEEPKCPPEMMYTILYGTDTGTAEAVSNRISAKLKSRGLFTKVCSFDETTVEEVASMSNVVIVCATAGQGEFPPNAKAFWAELTSSQYEHNTNLFENVKFAVMGLGDSAYVFYNQAAKKLDKQFEKLGAKRVCDTGLGDDQHEDGYDSVLVEWIPDFLTSIKAPEPKDDMDGVLPASFEVTPVETGQYKTLIHDGFCLIEVVKNERVTPLDYEVDVRHIEFDLNGKNLKYALGDSVALVPTNEVSAAERVCEYFGYSPDQWIQIKSATTQPMPKKYAALFSKPITVLQLLTEALDIFGKPPRNFYENLHRYATDPVEKATLKNLLEEKQELKKWQRLETVDCFDVIKKFPSVKPTLAQLLDLVNLLKPRYYSIASSQKFVGPTNLHLCVGVVQWTNSQDVLKFGEMTGVISRADPTKGKIVVNATIKPTCFNLPPTDKHPIVVAGMGTGIAPFRSFIQYRAMLKSQGKEVGPLSVYFGCRHKEKDFLYRSELEAFVADGTISELEVAFSRDQKEKDYIQHHIVRNSENFYQRLVIEDGYFYLCGSAKQVPIDVRRAVVTVLCKHGEMSESQAEELIIQWQLKGKYNVEAW